MFDNIMLGPACPVLKPEDIASFGVSLPNEGWLPIYETKKGELFDEIQKMHLQSSYADKKLLSVIITIGYRVIPKD